MSKVKRPSLGQNLISKSAQFDSDLWSASFGSNRSFRKNHVHFRILQSQDGAKSMLVTDVGDEMC